MGKLGVIALLSVITTNLFLHEASAISIRDDVSSWQYVVGSAANPTGPLLPYDVLSVYWHVVHPPDPLKPYQVCSASAIATNVVISAAHCFIQKDTGELATPDRVQVCGLSNLPFGSCAGPTALYRHPAYDRNTGHYDFALLVFGARVVAFNRILPMTNASIDDALRTQPVLEISGYGSPGTGLTGQRTGDKPDEKFGTLRTGTNRLWAFDPPLAWVIFTPPAGSPWVDKSTLGNTDDKESLCYHYKQDAQITKALICQPWADQITPREVGMTQGDSGGPWVYNGYLIAVTSQVDPWPPQGETNGFYGESNTGARVTSALDWINPIVTAHQQPLTQWEALAIFCATHVVLGRSICANLGITLPPTDPSPSPVQPHFIDSDLDLKNATGTDPGFTMLPDLAVTAVSNPPASAAPRSSFAVTDTVTNRGRASTVGSTHTQYYLSIDKVWSNADVLLEGDRSVHRLVPDASSVGPKVNVSVPATTPLGQYYLLACADATNVEPETAKDNNCLASTTAVQITRADLVVTAVSNPPAAVSPGDNFMVTDTVKNQGLVESGSSHTRYYLSLDTVKGSGDIFLSGNQAVPSLAPAASSSGKPVKVEVPSTIPLAGYYLLACADDRGSVTETIDANNCAASTTKVQVTWPDLIVMAVSSTPASAGRGGRLSVTDTTKNQGLVSADSSHTRYYLSQDGTKGSGAISLSGGSRSVPALVAGASSAVASVMVTIPPAVPPGRYYVVACADDTGQATETNKGNNCRPSAGQLTVTP